MKEESIQYIERVVSEDVVRKLVSQGASALLARILAGRGIVSLEEVDREMAKLLKPADMKGCQEAGEMLAIALLKGERVCIVADYDCDGASACAIMIRGLQMMGAKDGTVSYLVPDRQKDGYGLTIPIVERAIELSKPDILVTVDNGIASFEGCKRARDLGLRVIVTDHHLPAVVNGAIEMPDAAVIVNPNQPGCNFSSKALCGAGVAFYTLLMTRAILRQKEVFDTANQPKIECLLELVALATIGDVVRLDDNNRRLVSKGLERIRVKGEVAGIRALFEVSGKRREKATSTDLGFGIGPRINAAGRLSDMSIGIECLLSEEYERALELARQLHRINLERRKIESEMIEEAKVLVEQLENYGGGSAIVVFDEKNHEGVVGLISGKIKEQKHRPTFVFARAHDGNLKGSGRSIAGFHLRDALDLITKRAPGLILKFGGHAAAAGCTIEANGLEQFRNELVAVAHEWLTADLLERKVYTDGEFPVDSFNVETVKLINDQVWGQQFEEPIFTGNARVLEQRILNEKHLKLVLAMDGQRREGIWFGRNEQLGRETRLAFRASINEWQGRESVQLMIVGELQ